MNSHPKTFPGQTPQVTGPEFKIDAVSERHTGTRPIGENPGVKGEDI